MCDEHAYRESVDRESVDGWHGLPVHLSHLRVLLHHLDDALPLLPSFVRVAHSCDDYCGSGGCRYELTDTIDIGLIHVYGGSSSSNAGEPSLT